MAEYHVGCGAFAIYAGTLNKNKTMWKNKSDVTEEALDSVFTYLYQEEKDFYCRLGEQKYKLTIVKVEESD